MRGMLHRKARGPLGEEVLQLYVPEFPARLRREILLALHDHPTAAHIGKTKMFQQLKKRFYWPDYAADVARYVLTCDLCQRFNAYRHHTYGLMGLRTVEPYFTTIAIDFCGPFPRSRRGNKW